VERIKSAKWLKGERFEYPKDYNPEDFFDNALHIAPGEPVSIELIFTRGTKPFIQIRKYHKSQKLKALPDGRLQMTLKAPVNFDTLNWILSFGFWLKFFADSNNIHMNSRFLVGRRTGPAMALFSGGLATDAPPHPNKPAVPF
jgi:hypothetical protein